MFGASGTVGVAPGALNQGRMPTVRVEGYPQTQVTPMRRKGLNPQEREAEEARYKSEMAASNRAISAFQVQRAAKAGLTHYVWLTAGKNAGVCPRCVALDGKRFAYAKPPRGGHPGENACCPRGWCRCVAVAVIPGIDD